MNTRHPADRGRATVEREASVQTRRSIVDTDIHPVLDQARLCEFLPEPWRTRYASGNRGPGGVSWLPPLLWRFDKNWKALRQTAPWLDRPPSAVVEEHIRLTTQPLEAPERPSHLEAMLEMFDAGRMLMF